MRRIKTALVRDGYRLDITFDDGTRFTYAAENDLWGPVFEPLKDPALFAQVGIDECGALSWPNGADMDAQALYQKMKEPRPYE